MATVRRPKRKSHVAASSVKVVIHMADHDGDSYGEAPGYSGHNGGAFGDAGYRSGQGMFGFKQDL